MGGVLDYSTTANSNTTVGGVSIAEGMAPGNVNNGMRAQMADARKWQLDWSGITTAGTGNAYTITSNQGVAAYADGMRFSFRADRANTGAATLNVDGRGAKAIRRMDGSAAVALVSGDLIANGVYDVVYVLADDVFVVVNSFGTLPGLTATIAELNYMDGVTSAVQTQLNAKQASDATLTSLSGLTLAAGDLLYATGADTLVNLAKGTAGQVLRMNTGATAPEWGAIWSETSLITLSGASTDISTSIPAGVKRIRVWVNGVSMDGSSGYNQLQVGTGGSFVTTGYTRAASTHEGASVSSTSGFITMASNNQAPNAGVAGNVAYDLRLIDAATNTWMCAHAGSNSNNLGFSGNGTIALAGALDRLRMITTGSGGNFDAGTVFAEWGF